MTWMGNNGEGGGNVTPKQTRHFREGNKSIMSHMDVIIIEKNPRKPIFLWYPCLKKPILLIFVYL